MTGAFRHSLPALLLALAAALGAGQACSGGRARPRLPPPAYEEGDIDDAGATNDVRLEDGGAGSLSTARSGPRSW